MAGYTAGKLISKVAVKKFSKLPRSAKKGRLQKLYKTKGVSRNKNLRKYKSDKGFGEKLVGRTRLLVYSGLTSEFNSFLLSKIKIKF